MANLIAPRYIAPDPQKTWLAAEQERASQDRTSLARQSETSRSVEAQQRLAQSGAQTAMNLQTQMQNMAQKADMHPLQMIEAQKRNQNLSLSNQAAAQQLILNEDKHELDQLNGIARLSASRVQTQINKSTLEERIRQDGEAPIFSEKINLINQIIADPNRSLSDLKAIDSTGLSGDNLARYNTHYSNAVGNKEEQRTKGLAFKIKQQSDAQKLFLMGKGHLAESDINDPAKFTKAANAYTADIVARHAGSPGAMNVNQGDYTSANGIIDEVTYGNAIRRQAAEERGLELYQSTDSEGKTVNVYVNPASSRGSDGGKPSASQFNKDVSYEIKNLRADPAHAATPADDLEKLAQATVRARYGNARGTGVTGEEAMSQVYSFTPGASETGKELTDGDVLNAYNYAFTLFYGEGDVDWVNKNAKEYGTDGDTAEPFKAKLGHDRWGAYDRRGADFGFSPDKEKTRNSLRDKLEEKGHSVYEEEGIPQWEEVEKKENIGRIYWSRDTTGEQIHLWTYPAIVEDLEKDRIWILTSKMFKGERNPGKASKLTKIETGEDWDW